MSEGTIKRLTDKGFGFIDVGSDKDLFFHSSSLQGVSYDGAPRRATSVIHRRTWTQKAHVPRTSRWPNGAYSRFQNLKSRQDPLVLRLFRRF